MKYSESYILRTNNVIALLHTFDIAKIRMNKLWSN